MGFYLKRYAAALRTHRKWAFLVVLPLGLYLTLAALRDVTFTVSQAFSSYNGEIPVAAADSPTGTVKLNTLVADPDTLFLDGFALNQLSKKLALLEDAHGVEDDNALRRLAHSTLTLSATGNAGLRLSYTGDDSIQGKTLVSFYTDRLMKRIDEGMTRTKSRDAQPPLAFQPSGTMAVVGQKSIWNADRLRPALVVLALSSLGVMILIAIFEFFDPTFKSERQIARYLGLPVLGAIPDAKPLEQRLPD